MKRVILILVSAVVSGSLAALQAAAPEPQRTRMVEHQIEARGISDPRVLQAMRTVPRHEFVPGSLRAAAYDDSALPIGEGQTISQPYIVALMTELLVLEPGDRVLEVGTGSGYQAAVLAEIGAEVYTIEIIPSLADTARKLLARLGYRNITVRCGDGYHGWPDQAPFDAIIVTAAPDQPPPALVDQLKPGGRLVMPLGPPQRTQELVLITKSGDGTVRQERVALVRFVPLTRSPQ